MANSIPQIQDKKMAPPTSRASGDPFVVWTDFYLWALQGEPNKDQDELIHLFHSGLDVTKFHAPRVLASPDKFIDYIQDYRFVFILTRSNQPSAGEINLFHQPFAIRPNGADSDKEILIALSGNGRGSSVFKEVALNSATSQMEHKSSRSTSRES